jgi:hypothetical protein
MADDQRAADPSQAFDDLRAEVSVLRRAVEAIPSALADNRAPDYSPDLAVIGQGLDALEGSLEALTAHPALRMTPEQHGQAVANAGAGVIREAAQKLDRAAQEVERERSRLAAMIGQAQAQDRQFRALCWVGGVALAVGLVLSPVVSGLLPFGLNTHVAALVMREDRWNAGGDLMRAANHQGWAQLTRDANLISQNRKAITACRADAASSGKPQRCIVTVAPPSTDAAGQDRPA